MGGICWLMHECSSIASEPLVQKSNSKTLTESASPSPSTTISSNLAESNTPSSRQPELVLASNSPTDQVSKVLFACRTAQGKEIKLLDQGQSLRYSFGPITQPEIVLNVPREQASTYQWAGVGRSMYYSVNVPNKDTTYRVFWSVDRLVEGQPVSAGVDVEINDKYAATVQCIDKNITNGLIGVDLKPTQR
jgi:hypothetical protein